MSSDTQNPITTQPDNSIGAPPGSVPVNGVTVRILRDTPEDAAFAAKLFVEAFRGKFAHHITERNLPTAIKNQEAVHRGQDQAFYNRNFVAELDGRPVGQLKLKFKGDKDVEKDDHLSELGCWRSFRYSWLMDALSSEDIDNSSKCYLDHICVEEHVRGRGVGKVLMQRAEYEARLRNCSTIFLYVMTSNRAVSLYERQGYTIKRTMSCCVGMYLGPPGEVHEMEKAL